jgi:hypothetical protein
MPKMYFIGDDRELSLLFSHAGVDVSASYFIASELKLPAYVTAIVCMLRK